MPARTPEELDVLFANAINAGDIEAVIRLYEPGACLVPEPGQVVSRGPRRSARPWASSSHQDIVGGR